MDAFIQLLGHPIDGTNLSLFRFFFSLIICSSFIRKYGFLLDYTTRFDFYFKYSFFEWVHPFSKAWMRVLLIATIAAFATLSLGLFTKFSAFVALLLYSYLFLIDKATYNNHSYLIILILFLFNFVDIHNSFALDNLLFSDVEPKRAIPYWNLLIFQLQLLIVYFYGGLNKITYDWLARAEPMTQLFQLFQPQTVWNYRIYRYCFSEKWAERVSRFLKMKYVGLLFSWAGMLFDLTIIFFLLYPTTLPFALPFYCFFHLFNLWFFRIGVFPYISFAALLLFIPPTTLADSSVESLISWHCLSRFDLWFFIIYLTLQLLIPARRYCKFLLRPKKSRANGDYCWFFSWTMKLKASYGKIEVVIFDRTSNEEIVKYSIDAVIPKKQFSFLVAFPTAMIQYTKYIEKKFDLKSKNYGIKVLHFSNINNSGLTQMIDGNVDFTSEKISRFATYHWYLGD